MLPVAAVIDFQQQSLARHMAVELECLVVKWALDTLKYKISRERLHPRDSPPCHAVAWAHERLRCKDHPLVLSTAALPLHGAVQSGKAEHCGRLLVRPCLWGDCRGGGKCEKVKYPLLTASQNGVCLALPRESRRERDFKHSRTHPLSPSTNSGYFMS